MSWNFQDAQISKHQHNMIKMTGPVMGEDGTPELSTHRPSDRGPRHESPRPGVEDSLTLEDYLIPFILIK